VPLPFGILPRLESRRSPTSCSQPSRCRRSGNAGAGRCGIQIDVIQARVKDAAADKERPARRRRVAGNDAVCNGSRLRAAVFMVAIHRRCPLNYQLSYSYHIKRSIRTVYNTAASAAGSGRRSIATNSQPDSALLPTGLALKIPPAARYRLFPGPYCVMLRPSCKTFDPNAAINIRRRPSRKMLFVTVVPLLSVTRPPKLCRTFRPPPLAVINAEVWLP